MSAKDLKSERIKLRLIQLSDLELIHNLHCLPETDEFNTLGIPKNIEETKSIIEPWIVENEKDEIKNYTFAIENNITEKDVDPKELAMGIEVEYEHLLPKKMRDKN